MLQETLKFGIHGVRSGFCRRVIDEHVDVESMFTDPIDAHADGGPALIARVEVDIETELGILQ